jgi:subtilisin family serine protease
VRAISQLSRVEANQRVRTLNDPISTWGIEKISVNASVRNASTGTGVVVAVLDTGYEMNHPDLAGQFFVNSREVPGNGIDDDGSGFVDDVSGWDFVGRDSNPRNDIPTDVHGTHIAGTIAARTGNGIGVASVAPNTKILPLRFLGSNGSGSVFDAIQGVNHTNH